MRYSLNHYSENFKNPDLEKKWEELKNIRETCNNSIEQKRSKKEIGSSLEANLIIELDDKNFDKFKDINFSEICITSDAIVKKSSNNKINVTTIKAEGTKCPVCWKIKTTPCDRHSS